ncbi:MAG: hypothetical protein JSU09_14195 [Bacteroidetes bacterium]|nr:hypothetical protein [Bacteroidota bacterium]
MKTSYFVMLLFLSVAVVSLTAWDKPEKDDLPTTGDPTKSRAALGAMLKVLKHQRCMNCHPTDDRPRQGDDAHAHLFNVQRGTDNKGLAAMRCVACHQTENNKQSNVPGAPHWQLAPKSMGWMGLSDEQIAANLIDKSKNGNRSLDQLMEHMTRDPLVQWAWQPGEGRTVPPVSQKDFHEAVRTWIENGAVIK